MRLGHFVAVLTALLLVITFVMPMPDVWPHYPTAYPATTRQFCLALGVEVPGRSWPNYVVLDTTVLYADSTIAWYDAFTPGTPHWAEFHAWRPLENDSVELLGHGGWIARFPMRGPDRTGTFQFERSQPMITALLGPTFSIDVRDTTCGRAAV